MNLKIFLIALIPFVIASCTKDDEDLNIVPPENLGGEMTGQTTIDKWLLDSLTTPYNIAIKYRWDPWELNLDKTLTPPEENKIIPAMSAIKRVWIDPYNAETGSDLFMKKYSPKQFKLVGSVEYNYNGTVLLGQAEGGNNIAFFDINQNFDQDPVSSVKRMIQTSHHEFAHILHQNVMYPQEFKGISARLGMAGYTGTWFNISAGDAYANGYITPYAMSGYDDDFAEMVSVMLMEGKTRFDEIVAAQNTTAQNALEQKEQFVVNYFREVWSIDFYSLQNRVQNALNALAPPPDIHDAYNFNADFSTASVNIQSQSTLPQPESFIDMYEAAADALADMPAAYRLDSFQVISVAADLMYLEFYLKKGTQTITGLFAYEDIKTGTADHQYTIVGADSVGAEIQDAVLDILIYFNQDFRLSWHASPTTSIFPRVRFSPLAATDDYFIARLLP